MKRALWLSLSLLALGTGSQALAAVDAETLHAETLRAEDLAQYERVSSISALGGLHSFRAIDDDTLIIWRTAFDPYLVELAHPSFDLKWAHAIAVDSTTSRIHERFDSVRIRGFSYPIREIYKLTREQARQIGR